MTETDRLGLPLLAAGQAQKELVHNEALALLDITAFLTVESCDAAVPPPALSPGQCWIVASGGSGAWLDHDHAVAGWTAGGWLFLPPRDGWRAFVLDRGQDMRFDGTAWRDEAVRSDGFYVTGQRVVAARRAAITDPAGGATQDSEGRIAIVAILAAMRAHGLIAS